MAAGTGKGVRAKQVGRLPRVGRQHCELVEEQRELHGLGVHVQSNVVDLHAAALHDVAHIADRHRGKGGSSAPLQKRQAAELG